MAIEDYCFRVREAGKQVWLIDSYIEHASPGKLDDAYWRSAYKFRNKWKDMLPPETPSLKEYILEGIPGARVEAFFQLDVI